MGLEDRIKNKDPKQEISQELINNSFEHACYKLFYIDVMNLIDMKASLAKNFHIQPSEIDAMPYWEYEFFIMSLNNQVKEENEKQQSELDKYGIGDMMKNSNPKNMSKNMNSMTPKMPNFGSIKMPSFKM